MKKYVVRAPHVSSPKKLFDPLFAEVNFYPERTYLQPPCFVVLSADMASEGDLDHNMVIRNILANLQPDGGNSGGTSDCVAQLLAAAVAHIGNNAMTVSTADNDSLDVPNSTIDSEDAGNQDHTNFEFNPQEACDYDEESGVETTVEVPVNIKRKPICIKFPIELRKRIIAMRKEGKKCVEVAKELHISVSGAQKVWERFLATGMVHDRKPSTYAGRPRKYIQQVCKVTSAQDNELLWIITG